MKRTGSGRRWVAVSLAVAAVCAVAAMPAGVATASKVPPLGARSMHLSRSGLSLAHAPAGLRAAVHGTLGARAGSATWSQQAKLTASDAALGDFLGTSVAISGSTAVIGAPGKNSGTGAAYVFARSGTAWSQQAELTASDGAVEDSFGFDVGLSGSTVVAGADGKNSDTGAAYVYAHG